MRKTHKAKEYLMPGKRITDQQVAIYMNNRNAKKTQKLSAARAGISKRSGHDIEHGKRVIKKERTYRTRLNKFTEVFEPVIVPLLKKGVDSVPFLLRHLQQKFPGQFSSNKLRTLQRRVEEWKALHGKDKEVIFLQKHEAGRLAACDFTHPKKIKVTINGKPFTHIFFHLRLAYSGFSYVQVFEGSGESFEKFAQGLNAALLFIGGIPQVLRTDSLSAAFKNLCKKAKDDLTMRFKAVVEHYGMEPERINRGKSHENGSVESPHGHFKKYLKNSLIVRGSNDFNSIEEYQDFIQKVVNERNDELAKALFDVERKALKPLPSTKALDYSEAVAVVGATSTIEVKRVTYSVPSRLIKQQLRIRIYPDRLECYLGRNHAVSLNRKYAPKKKRNQNIDYRHVIGSLITKRNAFRNCQYRDSLLPNDQYRYIWKYVDETMERSEAGKFMVGLLYLAAKQDCEEPLSDKVISLISTKKKLSLRKLQDLFTPKRKEVPSVEVVQHDLSSYNELIEESDDD